MNIMEPKISKLEINLENRLKDSQKISVRLNANIIMPKDEKNKKYLVTEILEMTTDKKLRILSMEVRCPVSYEDEPELTSEQYQERIKTEIFPIIYQKILDVLDYFSDKTTIELPSIPSFPALQ
jgi:hypothetical protein